MKPEKRAIPSSEHEQVYHAAVRCQAASLSLTGARLRGLFWACPVESQKRAGFLALLEQAQPEAKLLVGQLPSPVRLAFAPFLL